MVKLAFELISPTYPEFSPLIFLHGITEHRGTWINTAPAISKNTNRKAYLLDARNHGESPRTDKMDFNSFSDDVLEFMNDQHIQKAIIIGFSFGGMIAINLALKYPARLETIIVEDISPKNYPTGEGTLSYLLIQNIDYLAKELPPDMDVETAKRIFMEKLWTLLPRDILITERAFKNYGPAMLPIKKVLGGFIPTADTEMLKKFMRSNPLKQDFPESGLTYDGDALFLYGGNSYLQVDEDPSIKKLFPRSVLKKVEDATHMIHVEFPEQFVEIVSNFILNLTIPQSKY